ncbi:Homeodomain-like DNA binding domain-containing transcription factor [Phycomyces blakesleeanus]|uniref:Homeodomain-like DNA binding domain-containing transcription factor n=2 Tax=Phycomyces blakesleeanus TaxID=4837 RepID=A0A163DCU1_PHYB8|nr:Homeodomain-like DNA binding domain-containing transcription factor [Phycomyces blakesleeanus NRRL 1555(-)]OAD70480.1 Homeodomain-like DNA binding domain-containing transcription factor [Phycomyces blakesleeanus NRRL 1555(-)]|eukprot:XP_018288520.1 Homeodomain-like DNA binding domain-containing transcription factor [Phycomyces blakesleeanus NRRL 1555(-)]
MEYNYIRPPMPVIYPPKPIRKIRKTTEFERGMIIGRFKCNMTITDISEAEGVPRETVNRIINKYLHTGSVTDRKSSGRPKIIQEDDVDCLREILNEDPQQTLTDITKKVCDLKGRSISPATVRKRLYELGLLSYESPPGSSPDSTPISMLMSPPVPMPVSATLPVSENAQPSTSTSMSTSSSSSTPTHE